MLVSLHRVKKNKKEKEKKKKKKSGGNGGGDEGVPAVLRFEVDVVIWIWM